MTNSDLRDARDELEERIRGRRSRDRRLVLVAVAVAVAVVGVLIAWRALDGEDPAPSTTTGTGIEPSEDPSDLSKVDEAFLAGAPPTPETLRGLWRLDNPTDSRMLFMYTTDGDVRYDDTGQLAGNPLVSGTYTIDDDLISVEVTGGQAGCSGQQLAFRGAMAAGGGVVHLLPIDAEPTSCDRPFRPQWVLERVLPRHVYADFAPPPGRNWDPLPGHEALLGTWLAGKAHYVIELLADDSYIMLAGAGEVVDRGTWVAASSTTALVLTSEAGSPSCQEGDRLMLTNLRARDIGALAIQGDLRRNDCDLAPWLGWVQLAP